MVSDSPLLAPRSRLCMSGQIESVTIAVSPSVLNAGFVWSREGRVALGSLERITEPLAERLLGPASPKQRIDAIGLVFAAARMIATVVYKRSIAGLACACGCKLVTPC